MKKLMGSVATVAVCAGFFGVMGTGTAAAVNTQPIDLWDATYGYAQGGVTFHNRDVVIQGSVKSHTTGCAQAEFEIFANFTDETPLKTETRTACGRGTGTSTDFHFTVDMPAGGAAYLRTSLNENTTGSWKLVSWETANNTDRL
ncbi:hypothetical protein [Streptomyces lunaelactis]|nr:hypothetical protein [Streptomyces lunaelactis]NUK83954.1 hypothetical protein [Streptomyces lunaelactis]